MKQTNWYANLASQYAILWLIWLGVQDYLYGELIKLPATANDADFIVNTVIKSIVWLGLGIWWLHSDRAQLWLSGKLYNRHFPTLFWELLILFVGYLLVTAIYEHHSLTIMPDLFTRERHGFIGVALIAGVTEEFIFRGYFMNRLLHRYAFMTANIIQALLFLGIHLPIYFVDHLSMMGWLNNVLTVLPLGLIFGWVFYRSKNLWPSTILHCVWDAMIFALI
ncbi:hypothetical protein YK48G_07950 [Lentilactobacillus fungorum]|uniref:CAAX prenyl protease 2/Lysostaphin resistance protein A-like domain-containing protein n=1 Tax=Lentilactobacillus fungorum TaxID=2201250 RepID=A0ABQ3VWU4_9LACO|nr:CPBP family intramembrane glutamic endopeptidase [Lentilactobacillus fungorum]GHP13370.1 hypothetical protein YK48G_07950 [Lentilactobacillus fungorum]